MHFVLFHFCSFIIIYENIIFVYDIDVLLPHGILDCNCLWQNIFTQINKNYIKYITNNFCSFMIHMSQVNGFVINEIVFVDVITFWLIHSTALITCITCNERNIF